jgi:hypothetical protein
MDIAHSVALLNAHAGVLEAEIVRIEADIEALHNVAERYAGSSGFAASTRNAEAGLSRLRDNKRQQLGEVKQQLDLFRLHLPAAQQLLKRLRHTQRVELPSSTFPPPSSSVNAVVESQILAAVNLPAHLALNNCSPAALPPSPGGPGQTSIVTPARQSRS